MKKHATRTLAALLAALMLLLAIPFAGTASSEEAIEPITLFDINSSKGKDLNYGYGSATPDWTFHNLTGKKPTPFLETVTVGSGEYISFGAMVPTGQDPTAYDMDQSLLQIFTTDSSLAHRKEFTLSVSFAKNDNPLPLTIRLNMYRFNQNVSGIAYDANGEIVYSDADCKTPLTKTKVYQQASDIQLDFFVLNKSGSITFGDSKTTGSSFAIGNITDGSYDISCVFTYSDALGYYTVDIFANGALIANDLKFSPSAAAKDYTATATGVSGYFKGTDGTYTKTTGDVTYKVAAPAFTMKEYANGYEDSSLPIPTLYRFQLRTDVDVKGADGEFSDVREDGAYSKHTLRINNFSFVLGEASSANAMRNADKFVYLYANGLVSSLPGFCTVGNRLCGVFSEVASNGSYTLPALASGKWVDFSGKTVTEVTEAGASYYAVTPDGMILSEDFDDGTSSITLNNDSKVVDGALHLFGHLEQKTSATTLDHSIAKKYVGANSVNFTYSFKVTPKTEKLPAINVRFRDGNSFNGTLFGLTTNGIQFGGKYYYDFAKDVTYRVAILLNVYNTFDADGNINGSKTDLTAYINGGYVGTVTLTNETSSAITTLNTGTKTDIARLQWHAWEKTTVTENREVAIDDIRFYFGADRETLPEIYALPGASIRVGNTVDESGLRFSFGINREWFESLEGATVGAIILPADYVTGEITHAALGTTKYLDVTLDGEFSSESTEDMLCFNASIVKLWSHNYARAFVAVGYVKVGDTYYYSSASNSRSVAEVARNYAASGNVTAAHAERVKQYNDSVIYATVSGGELKLTETANYTSPYTVLVNSGSLIVTLTEDGVGNLSMIKAIVINGEVYTGGWEIAGDTLTAPYEITAE